jgi:N-methylhydantoinase A
MPKGTRVATFFNGGECEVEVFERSSLGLGATFDGPLIVEEPQTTSVVLAGQRLEVGHDGELVVLR